MKLSSLCSTNSLEGLNFNSLPRHKPGFHPLKPADAVEQDTAQLNPTDPPLSLSGVNWEQAHQNWWKQDGPKPAGIPRKALPARIPASSLPARSEGARVPNHTELSCSAISCASYPRATDCANMNVISLNNHQSLNRSQATQRPNNWRWSREGLFAGSCNTC